MVLRLIVCSLLGFFMFYICKVYQGYLLYAYNYLHQEHLTFGDCFECALSYDTLDEVFACQDYPRKEVEEWVREGEINVLYIPEDPDSLQG